MCVCVGGGKKKLVGGCGDGAATKITKSNLHVTLLLHKDVSTADNTAGCYGDVLDDARTRSQDQQLLSALNLLG